MRNSAADNFIDHRSWSPECGAVFASTFTFTCATTLVDNDHPWIVPGFVIGAASDGTDVYFVLRQNLTAFFQAHAQNRVVMHDAASGLAVIDTATPGLAIYDRADADQVWDTALLHRLYQLASAGHTASGQDQSGLEHCSRIYRGVELCLHLKDSRGRSVQRSYAQWLNQPFAAIEPIYLESLANVALATYRLYRRLRKLIRILLKRSTAVWGFVSHDWLDEQNRRWGPLTHHIQLKASIVLKAITATGLHLDGPRRQELSGQLESILAEQRLVLHTGGYLPGQPGCARTLQVLLRRLQAKYSMMAFPRTATGQFATSEEALAPLANYEPFIASLLNYKATERLQFAFLNKMGRPVLHPSFDVLKTTGRTSSAGDLNVQGLPRDDRIRNLFVPPPSHVWINADYSAIEMVTLAQATLTQFGLSSKLASMLNSGKDVHTMVAALALGKPEAEVTPEERQKSKPINFGKPGAMGSASLREYARLSYGVDLSDDEVERLSEAWFAAFPEMQEFLAAEHELAYEVATSFGLTPHAYQQHTGSVRFTAHLDNPERRDQPSSALGGMCLKVLKDPEPTTGHGRPYSPAEIDFFWTMIAAKIKLIPAKCRDLVYHRRPSADLQRNVRQLIGRGPVFTLTGRLRAEASYSARHNNIFQGLAADGAKLALWKLWRAGYSISNFIHDEVLIAIPADEDLEHHVARVSDLLIAGMKQVVPDVCVSVQCAVTTVWSKKASAVRNADGRLVPWSPPASTAEQIPSKPTDVTPP